MSKINKLITNKPVTLTEEEVTNLSKTLSAVQTAGGGGGGGGRVYYGDNATISVNQVDGIISLTTDATEKLNTPIPTKVSDLSDHEDYQTTAGMSNYLTTNDAASTYQPKGDYLSANALADYYQKTETSGASELNTAFGSKQDNLTQEQLSAISSVSSIKGTVLAGDANIRTTSAEDGNNIKWTIELTAQPVVTDTTLSGYDGIVATKDSTINSQWNIGIAQAYKEQIEAVSSKLTETVADTLYAPISVTGDIDTLKSSSGNWDQVSAKLDTSAFSTVSGNFISAAQPFTANLGGASKITVFGESNLEVNQHSNVIFTQNTQFSAITNNLVQGEGNSYNGGGGASFIQGQYNTGAYCSMAQGLHNNAGNQSQAFGIGNVITNTGMAIGTYNKTSSDASFVIGNGTNSNNRSDLFIIKHDGTVSSTGDFIVDGKSLSNVYNTVSTNSGEWLKESDLNYYVTSSDITTRDTDYVMTTSGWKVLTLPGGGMTQVIHDATLTGQGNADDSKLGVAWSALSGNVSSKLDTTAAAQTYLTTATYAVDSATFLTKSSADNDYAPISITATVNTLTAASAGWNNKVDKPTELVNQYLVLRTDDEGNVSGWCDFQDQSYSKSEADRTFVATAYIDTTTLSGNGKSVSTKLGVKTNVFATTDYVNSSFLPTSGGTVSGQLEVHGGSNFDSQFIKLTREGNSCGARIGLGSDTTNGTLALKTFNGQGQNTVQVNIKHNTNNNELIQVQKGGSEVGFLIPAVTANTTAGLTNDGILHIILES